MTDYTEGVDHGQQVQYCCGNTVQGGRGFYSADGVASGNRVNVYVDREERDFGI